MIKGEVTDKKLKEAILHEAGRCGCDIDGDIISYEGNRYIVYLYTNTVIREKGEVRNMMKECTILAFDETEELRNRLDCIIDNLKKGRNKEIDPAAVCEWTIEQLKEIREQFN